MKLVALLAFLCGCHPCPAVPFTDAQAVRAIVGEAGGEGRIGIVAVASALYNRGTLRGVYGYYSKTQYPPAILRQARSAWRDAKSGSDITHGATHWGTDADIATGTYAGLTKTVKIGAHTFFK